MAVSQGIISFVFSPLGHSLQHSPNRSSILHFFGTSSNLSSRIPSTPTRRKPNHPPPPSVSGIWDAITGGGAGDSARRQALFAIRRGMQLFKQGDVEGSLVEFDKAIELDPRQKAYLWQRGLSLYYLDRFEEGAEQFRIDVAQNPNDTEESIWCFLCEAQLYGADEARRRFLEVGRDPRAVMREAYNMFKDGGDPEKNEPDGARVHIIAACESPYGLRSDDYMASLAKVHSACRKWSSG